MKNKCHRGRKHCEKRRNCLLQASTALYLKLVEMWHCVEMGYSLPNDKISDQSKLKAFADDEINGGSNDEFCLREGRKHGEKRKCW